MTTNTVEFGHGDPPLLDGYVVVRSDNGRWSYDRSGAACIVRPFVPGRIAAPWKLDPPAGALRAASTSLRVFVNDDQCAGGRSPDDRLHDPHIHFLPGAILVTFTADELRGVQQCVGHPPVRRTIRLPERLGDRALLDGATVPALPPCLLTSVYGCTS